MTASPSAELIRLPPLTAGAVGELVEAALGEAADPVFVGACVRATRGTPFLLRELIGALRDGRIAPTAESACHVERIGARSVGRSINLRLRRLPDHAGRLARALAVLEQSELAHAARLADLDPTEAADAAGLLAGAGIIDAGLPLTFVHPIVRSGIYAELSATERARTHRRAAHLLAEQPDANERVAQHLLATEPAHDAWAVERLTEAARAARARGASEAEAVLLRRALDEPPAPHDEYGVLLDLGMAEASVGRTEWSEHLRRAVELAPDGRSGADAAMVLGYALSRAQRFTEAVEVLDRATASLEPRHPELARRVDASALFPRLNDPATAHSITDRLDALRKWASGRENAPPELLAALAFCSVLRNEDAQTAAGFATRALVAGCREPAEEGNRPWYSFSSWFSMATFPLVWTDRYAHARPLLDRSIAQARATGDSSRLTMGLATRGWLALHVGDLRAAEEDTRTALAATALPAPPMYRVLNTAVLVLALVDQGELDSAEEALAPFDPDAQKESVVAAILRFARGRLRIEQGRADEALEDFSTVGSFLAQVQVTCPGFLPWRSEAALAQLALGEQAGARRLAEEELELARTFGTARALGVAKRALGLAAGGDRGELLLREAVEAFERGEARVERARALTDLGAMLRRRNRRREARALVREALDVAHRAGAYAVAQRAETELRASGGRPRRFVLGGLESLTASERRIADLASRSLTNREIAQMLFVTDRTVEGHLTSVFRKLNVHSRSELSVALAS